MNECQNVQQMLGYMTECTLATVSDLSMRSRTPKGELSRQISIAQQGVDFIRFNMEIDLSQVVQNGPYRRNTRLETILRGNGKVQDWLDDLNKTY